MYMDMVHGGVGVGVDVDVGAWWVQLQDERWTGLPRLASHRSPAQPNKRK